MIAAYTTAVLAETHGADLRRQAGNARLAALARCCRPSTWARTARHAGEVLRHVRAAVVPERTAAACCSA
jgi:hypothetical protein